MNSQPSTTPTISAIAEKWAETIAENLKPPFEAIKQGFFPDVDKAKNQIIPFIKLALTEATQPLWEELEAIKHSGNCAYCGQIVDRTAGSIADHALNCERHPLHSLKLAEKEITKLQSQIAVKDEALKELELQVEGMRIANENWKIANSILATKHSTALELLVKSKERLEITDNHLLHVVGVTTARHENKITLASIEQFLEGKKLPESKSTH